MKKSTFIKKMVALFLVVLMSINAFASVVDSSDGGAFVTKEEFDNMRGDFDSQLDRYSNSIDNKIDGAIASYLAGLNIAEKRKIYLDPKCNYTLPLTCYFNPTKSLWNDEHSAYYKLSVPKLFWTQYNTWICRMASDCSLENDADLVVNPGGGGPYTVPVDHRHWGDSYAAIRAQYGVDSLTYPGRMGELYRIDKDPSATRTISGTEHNVWNLRDILHGQDNLYYFQGGISGTWDGKNDIYRPWIDFWFLGYYEENNFSANMQTWTTPSKNNYDAWTYNYLKCEHTHQTMGWATGGTIQPESNHNHNNWSNYSMATTCYNAMNTKASEVSSNRYINTNWITTPNVRVVDTSYVGRNTMIFAGDADLPSYNDNGYSYTPRYRTNNKSTTLVTYKADFYAARDKLYFWNFNPSTTVTGGPYTNLNYIVFPEWHATPLTDYRQDTGYNFSTIRASLVRYQDSNGKYHYMDEGMFLGTFEDNGKVKFDIKVTSSATNAVNLIISKQPIDINRNTNHYPKFTYEVDGTKTTVAAKTIPTIPTNKVIKIEVPDILRGEELYMIWWPAGSEYVELTQFDNFYLYTE